MRPVSSGHYGWRRYKLACVSILLPYTFLNGLFCRVSDSQNWFSRNFHWFGNIFAYTYFTNLFPLIAPIHKVQSHKLVWGYLSNEISRQRGNFCSKWLENTITKDSLISLVKKFKRTKVLLLGLASKNSAPTQKFQNRDFPIFSK